MKKLYVITRGGKPLRFGENAKYSWTKPVYPLRYLKAETSIRDIKIKVIDFTQDTVTSVDALEFIQRYEDPRVKAANLAKALGRSQWKPYTIAEMQRLLKKGSLTEEQSELVGRYIELWS